MDTSARDQSGGMASRLPAIREKSVERTHLIISGTHSDLRLKSGREIVRPSQSTSLTNESTRSKKGTSFTLEWIRRSLRCKLPAETSSR